MPAEFFSNCVDMFVKAFVLNIALCKNKYEVYVLNLVRVKILACKIFFPSQTDLTRRGELNLTHEALGADE
jgi:hypothetical protein